MPPPNEGGSSLPKAAPVTPMVFRNSINEHQYHMESLLVCLGRDYGRDTEEVKRRARDVNRALNVMLGSMKPEGPALTPRQSQIIMQLDAANSFSATTDTATVQELRLELLKTISYGNQRIHAALQSRSIHRPETPAGFETTLDRLVRRDREIREVLAKRLNVTPENVPDQIVWEELDREKKMAKAEQKEARKKAGISDDEAKEEVLPQEWTYCGRPYHRSLGPDEEIYFGTKD
ncbi:hypothetical protein F5X68DRAFT_237773 [Plectosphaerella plurivora]|uniref:Uncharacterized protein n=1 Tax=Plectosphaerella plurivora TaxID=936078 RepID=A0A9P8V0N0_9PEZI|nr:hypothetical protein F5X68DRAFT_237773 [Plectosphaerella plurivora]